MLMVNMVNISIILPMHFEAMALYEVSAMNRYAKVALMNSSGNLAKAKGSHMHLTMARRIISILLERPHPPSAGTNKSQRRVGTRKRPKKKNQN